MIGARRGGPRPTSAALRFPLPADHTRESACGVLGGEVEPWKGCFDVGGAREPRSPCLPRPAVAGRPGGLRRRPGPRPIDASHRCAHSVRAGLRGAMPWARRAHRYERRARKRPQVRFRGSSIPITRRSHARKRVWRTRWRGGAVEGLLRCRWGSRASLAMLAASRCCGTSWRVEASARPSAYRCFASMRSQRSRRAPRRYAVGSQSPSV
jgi:hypothetical protein